MSEENELCSKSTQPINKIKQILKSYSNSITCLTTTIYSISDAGGELCNELTQLDSFFWIEWTNLLKYENYVEIIYFLLQNEVCYANGLCKIFSVDLRNAKTRLSHLEILGIVEVVPKEEYRNTAIFSQKKYFGLYDYHFNKAVFYRLTKLAKAFFREVSYENVLNAGYIERVNNFRSLLQKTHKIVEEEIRTLEIEKESYFQQYKEHRMGYSHEDNLMWIEKRAKNLGVSSEELLLEFEKKKKGDEHAVYQV